MMIRLILAPPPSASPREDALRRVERYRGAIFASTAWGAVLFLLAIIGGAP